jgi:hypothetical protein
VRCMSLYSAYQVNKPHPTERDAKAKEVNNV